MILLLVILCVSLVCAWREQLNTNNEDEPRIILIYGRSYLNSNLILECNDG